MSEKISQDQTQSEKLNNPTVSAAPAPSLQKEIGLTISKKEYRRIVLKFFFRLFLCYLPSIVLLPIDLITAIWAFVIGNIISIWVACPLDVYKAYIKRINDVGIKPQVRLLIALILIASVITAYIGIEDKNWILTAVALVPALIVMIIGQCIALFKDGSSK